MLRLFSTLPHSLRGRLLLGTLAWVLVSVLVAGWVLADLFRQHAARQMASELAVHMNQLVAALSVNAQGQPTLQFEPTDPRFQRPFSGLYWQVDQREPGQAPREAVFHSRSLWDEVLRVPSVLSPSAYDGLDRLTGPSGIPLLALVRQVTPPEGAAAYRLVVAADQALLDQPLTQFRLMLAVSLGVLAVGMILAAVMQVVVGLRPLATLRTALLQVREGRQTRIEGRFPLEVQPLVDDFNQVLQNNHQIVQRARTHAGNLAHALKTPLSVLANAARNEPGAFGQLVAEQVESAQRHVDHHLARARAAAAVQTPGVMTPVHGVAQGLARVLTKVYAEKNIQIDVSLTPENLVFNGEAQDLQEMLGNVLDNACKWADRHVWLSITAGLPANDVAESRKRTRVLQVVIEDDGPGLPADQHQSVFGRGVRLDERKPGSGLGLAIVRDLAQTYGGAVTVGASRTGGLAIQLTLPGGVPP